MAKRTDAWTIKILETPAEMEEVETLQRMVWPGSETDVVPLHVLITFAHNGGLVIGAFAASPEEVRQAGRPEPAKPPLVGFVFGFPGYYTTPDGPRLKHCSHQLAVHPDHRGLGLGFALKRAQWQMVRHQGIDRITWTYDPLLSRNAHLNITRLGAVCNTYLPDLYGDMRDGLNRGLPSDRFQVDWWVNTQRVQHRLSRHARAKLDLAHFLGAGAVIINPSRMGEDGLPRPASPAEILPIPQGRPKTGEGLLLVEIPADYQSMRNLYPDLALEWRLHTRQIFQELYALDYLTIDFVHLGGSQPRSFYLISHGEKTLE